MSRAIPLDEKTPGVVARDMARPPITPERMLGERDTDQIIYRSGAVHPRHQANFRVLDPVDFLAEVSAHIPDAHGNTTLFNGWYSNRTRGYRRRRGLRAKAETAGPPPSTDHWTPFEVRRSWARLIRQVYEVDPLLCSRCGGTMRVIAVIEQPAVVRQILAHLGLPSIAPSFRAPPDPSAGVAADPSRAWSYEPFLDDLPVVDPVMA